MVSVNPRLMSKHCSNFYSNLYSSKYCEESTSNFLDAVNNVTQIESNHKEFCDDPICLEEVLNAIEYLKNNRSPGVDGLTAEFFKTFAEQLAPFILEMLIESICKGTLPPTLTQGLISLIPEPHKDHFLIM